MSMGIDVLGDAVEALAQGAVPAEISKAFMLANMTALRKDDGGARGIASGIAFRRMTARTLARQFGPEMEEAFI